MVDFLDDIVNDMVPIPDLMTIKEIRQEFGWPFDYTTTIGFAPYIRRMGNDVTGIEIGTGRGEGAYYLLEKCPGLKTLYTIDPYVEFQDWNGVVTQAGLDKQKEIAQENFKEWGGRVECLYITASQAAYQFPDASQHFVFIDGNHAAESVYEDLTNYYGKVRKNGIVSGTNYNMKTVRDGLQKWRDETKNRYPLMTTTNNVWFFYKR